MTRLIDADKLHDLFDKKCVGDCNVCNLYYVIHNKDCKGHSYCGLIDNAPTVEEKPKGEWFDCLPNGLLKARHGDYVVYQVDYLLEHLAREVWLLNSDIRIKTYREGEEK